MKMKWSQDFILLTILFQYYEMSYGLNVEMHKQTEIVKRMSAIIGQVLPFLSQEHQQQVATAVDRAKQVTMADLSSAIGPGAGAASAVAAAGAATGVSAFIWSQDVMIMK